MKYKNSRQKLYDFFFTYIGDKAGKKLGLKFMSMILETKIGLEDNILVKHLATACKPKYNHDPVQSCDESWTCTKCHEPVDVDGDWGKCSVPDRIKRLLMIHESHANGDVGKLLSPSMEEVVWKLNEIIDYLEK